MASSLYNRFKANLANKIVDWEADTIKVQLHTSTYAPDVDQDVIGDLTNEVASGGGYTTGGATLANASVTQDDTNDLAKLDGDDVAWTSATFTAAFAVFVDDTVVTDDLICWFDFGGDQTVASGTFTIQFHADGIITLT